MLNIISRSIVEGGINGPQKVVSNLIKGLDILGYPYCINKDLEATSQVWIHDDKYAVEEASKRKIKAVVGPNIYILPRNIPAKLDMSSFVYIHPSKWICDFWVDLGFNKCPIDFWPAAIDTTEFNERKKPENGIVLIYQKQRPTEELDFVKEIFERRKIKYEIITYRHYTQQEYVEKLKNTKYVLWLGRHETQGIALEEALAMNVPVLVWDVLSIGHWTPTLREQNIYTNEELKYSNTTSAYYFDDTCGIKTKNKNEIESSIDKMETNWKQYTPRRYITENLGLEKQAKELLGLYSKYFDISYEDGKNESLKNNKKWENDTLKFKFFSFCKFWVKKIIGRKG